MTTVVGNAVHVAAVHESLGAAWWDLAEEDPQSLPEHSAGWMRAMAACSGHRDSSLGFELTDGRRFVLPLASLRRRPGCRASHATGWGMGGLFGPQLDHSAVAAVAHHLDTLVRLRLQVRPEPRQALMWDEVVASSTVRVPRRGHVLDLPENTEDVLPGFSSNGRRNVRKAIRSGVEVRLDTEGELIADYLELRERSLERWAATTKTPLSLLRMRDRLIDPPRKLSDWKRELGDRCQIRIAFHEGSAVAGTVVLAANTAHYTRGVMDVERAGPVRATHLLQYEAITSAVEAGLGTYHLGESGDSVDLARFKESLGAQPVDHHEFRFERVPLTAVDARARAAAHRAIAMARGNR